MKIKGSSPINPGQLYKVQQKKIKQLEEQTKVVKDRIEISPQAQKIKEFTRKTIALPDIRKEQVEGIMKKIDDGEYNINAEQIAKSMLENI